MRLSAVLKPSATGDQSFADEATGKADRRRSDRRSLMLSATANPPSAGEFPVVVRDISPRGLLIEAKSTTLSPGDLITVDLPDKGMVTAQVVWASGVYFGCELDQAISPAAVSAALLKADPRDRPTVTPSVTRTLAARLAPRGISAELNFSMPFYLALFLWGIIGLAIYLML
jgi:hypothetical protein